MEKAILFEPELLAEVERKSPDLYEYYCSCPLTRYEFVDYGNEEFPMYIQKGMMELLEPYKKDARLKYPIIMVYLQAGYVCGHYDLQNKHAGPNIKMMESALLMRTVINTCLKYPCYTIEDLLNVDNFDIHNGIPYSKLTYKEAQYFLVWDTIFERHEDWNYFFVKLKEMKKNGEWNENDDKLVWDFPEYN